MVEKTTKKIEIPMVKLEIEITEEWFKEIEAGILANKEKYGKELEIGEYIETAVNGMANYMALQAKQIEELKARELLPPDSETPYIG